MHRKGKCSTCFDEAFENLQSGDVTITNMETRINGDSALVCSTQHWATVNKDGSENPLLIMRQQIILKKWMGNGKFFMNTHQCLKDGAKQ